MLTTEPALAGSPIHKGKSEESARYILLGLEYALVAIDQHVIVDADDLEVIRQMLKV